MLVTKQFLILIDFCSIFFFHTMEVSGDQQLFGYPDSSKYNILCLTKERTLTGLL